MRKNPVKEKLARGEPTFGTWLSLGDLYATRVISRLGFDWFTLDIEHSAIDWSQATMIFGAIADAGSRNVWALTPKAASVGLPTERRHASGQPSGQFREKCRRRSPRLSPESALGISGWPTQLSRRADSSDRHSHQTWTWAHPWRWRFRPAAH